ncbi:MAG TPA: cob(I)yrinic acid a,c-diamide adenosyltransferase [Chitinophagaceae bacterium]|nr:cob(I)yrinic acid a,c-diamide adenosyltransferase [Chitinophagaceae bacterium]
MAHKIYTKTGDKGKTSLIGGTKILKSDLRIEAYGTIDELNSWIGYIADYINDFSANQMLKEVQDRLFTIGSSLACDPEKETKLSIPDLREEDVIRLETEMDTIAETLPEMKHFILPGGHSSVSVTHIARCVCRRAERYCVRLSSEAGHVDPLVLKYLNRLSDYLFILARYLSKLHNSQEIAWTPRV